MKFWPVPFTAAKAKWWVWNASGMTQTLSPDFQSCGCSFLIPAANLPPLSFIAPHPGYHRTIAWRLKRNDGVKAHRLIARVVGGIA